MKRYSVLSMAWLALLIALPGVALSLPREGPPEAGRQVYERFREVRARVLREKVGLDEEKAGRVEQILDELQPQRRELFIALREQSGRLKELLSSDSDDQEAYRSVLNEMLGTYNSLHQLKTHEIEVLSQGLTPKEQARVLVALRKMRHRAHRMFHERRKKGFFGGWKGFGRED